MKLIPVTSANQEAYQQFHKASHLSQYMSRIEPGPHVKEWYYIEDDHKLIGAVWIEEDRADCGRLGIFIADEAYCGKGIGSRVINEVLTRTSFSRIVLNVRETNGRAINAYKKCGFYVNRHYVKDNGIKVIEMIREL